MEREEIYEEVLHIVHKLTTLLNTPSLSQSNIENLNTLINEQLGKITPVQNISKG